MISHYILIEISTTLTDDTIDSDGVVTEVGTKNLAKNALLQLGLLADSNPVNITHLRPSLDGQKIIVELKTDVVLTKQKACDKLAELLPWTSQQISNNTTFSKFAGNTWEERRQSVLTYLRNNEDEWET